MSLDITLIRTQATDVFDANITHNLTGMAQAAGIYKPIWRPEECGIKTAGDLVTILRDGLDRLISDPEKYKAHNPENGWGNYEAFVDWVDNYWSACKAFPDATINLDR